MKKISILTTIAVFLGSLVIPAWAGDHHGTAPHAGKWAWTAYTSCIQSDYGFDGTFTPLCPGGSCLPPTTYTSSQQGVSISDGWGHATVHGSGVFTQTSPPQYAYSTDFSFQTTTSIAPDGTITRSMVPNSLTGTILTGPYAGLTLTQDLWSPVSVRVSDDGKTQTATTIAPVVETITLNLPAGPFNIYQICNVSQVLIRLGDVEWEQNN